MRSALQTRWAPLLARALPVDPPAVRTVVVAPHPDDETLLAGGLISLQRRRGVPVVVVAVTDGGAAYPTHPDGPLAPAALASRRREEQIQACQELSVAAVDVHRLDIGDGAVPAAENELADRLRPLLTADTLLVAPWSGDVHSDHEAVGRACARAAARAGALLWEGVFWTWHHRRPEDLGDRAVVRVDLTPADVQARAAALACHRSQVTDELTPTPILDPAALEPMSWPTHHFLSP